MIGGGLLPRNGWETLSPRDRGVAVILVVVGVVIPAAYWSVASNNILIAVLGVLVAGAMVLWASISYFRTRSRD